MPRTARKPLTEQDFILHPTGKQFLDYARYNIGSMISSVEMKWNPGHSGMSLDLFVNDAALYAIELAREDLQEQECRFFQEILLWKNFKSIPYEIGRFWNAPRRETEHPAPPSALRQVDPSRKG